MPEAEEVIGDAARHATEWSLRAWRRLRGGTPPPVLELAAVRRRLELLTEALCGPGIAIRAANPPPPPTLLARLARRARPRRDGEPLPGTDGVALYLPAALLIEKDDEEALSRYRLLALLQALRCRRGTARHFPFGAPASVRDLFLIGEAALASRELASLAPGLRSALLELRRACLARRPEPSSLTGPERRIEAIYRESLAAGLEQAPAGLTVEEGPAATLRWALDLAADAAGRDYHGIPSDPYLGEILPAEAAEAGRLRESGADAPQARGARSSELRRRPRVRRAREGEDDPQQGIWMVQTSEPSEHAEDPLGLQRPTDRDENADPEGLADSLAELPEARLVRTSHTAREVLLSADPPPARGTGEPTSRDGERVLRYPEWDHRRGTLRPDAVAVRVLAAPEGPQAWVDEVLARHRTMLAQVRRRFQAIRARRSVLPQQPDGEEVDLDAYVRSWAETCVRRTPAERLYQIRRPARRDLALVMLVDASASTDGWVAAHDRIIDVEKEALLVVAVALQALDLPCAVVAFSGRGPQGVTVRHVKRFDEGWSAGIGRRIAALEPEEFTRTGAAIRHATDLLVHRSAFRRLLLLLSDGKPNDVDIYDGRYGMEDMRQALREARGLGIDTFGLTVEREGAACLPALFGPGRYTIVRRPEQLCAALVDWLRHAALSVQ